MKIVPPNRVTRAYTQYLVDDQGHVIREGVE